MDLTTIAILFIGFCLIILLLSIFFGKSNNIIKEATYKQRGALFSVAERSFYGVLEQAISKDYKIFGKVRVADVLTPKSNMNKSNWQTAFNKISAKHFDYVLCQKETLKVVGVIELDDKSHNSKRAKKRDAFLEDACEGAGLKLIRFKAKAGYQIDSVREYIVRSLISSEDKVVNALNFNIAVIDKNDNERFQNLETNAKSKVSSSKLAKKLGVKTPELLDKMVKCRYLVVIDEVHHLTEKGKEVGGEFIEKSRFPAHFIWSEDLIVREEIN